MPDSTSVVLIVWLVIAVAYAGYEFVNSWDDTLQLIHDELPYAKNPRADCIVLILIVGISWPLTIPAALHDWYAARKAQS